MAYNTQQTSYFNVINPGSGNYILRATVCCGKGTFQSVNEAGGPNQSLAISGIAGPVNPDVYFNSPLVSGIIYGNI